MTQNKKDLLLKDLCARLPYGIKVAFFNEDLTHHSEPKTLIGIECINNLNYSRLEDEDGNTTIVEFVKPYLFPLSSMTAEQKEFIKNKFCYDWDIDDHPYSLWAYCVGIGDVDELIDWFHKNHIDYRGLIPMGLANDATGLNIY